MTPGIYSYDFKSTISNKVLVSDVFKIFYKTPGVKVILGGPRLCQVSIDFDTNSVLSGYKPLPESMFTMFFQCHMASLDPNMLK